MQIRNFCILLVIVAAAQFTYSQQVNKVIISGNGGQHDVDVKNAFNLGYSSYNNAQFPGEIILYSNTLQTSFNYAAANDFDLIVRSTSGLSTALRIAPDYPTVELVMPSGSNSYTQTFYGEVLNSPVVITGAGNDSNQTGYKLEFFSQDPITVNNLSSYSNGYIAGQLAFIANTLDCSFDSARAIARESGSENGVFDTYNGFGKILPDNILEGELPVELVSFTANMYNNSVALLWKTATEVNNYGFEIQRRVKDGTVSGNWVVVGFVNGNGNSNTSHEYTFTDNNYKNGDKLVYRLKQVDTDGKFEYSNEVEVNASNINYTLSQNYPNPFNPATTIDFNLAEENFVSICIYSVLGEKVSTIANQFYEAGNHKVVFNAEALSTGVYIYKIEVGVNGEKFSQVKKMNLIK